MWKFIFLLFTLFAYVAFSKETQAASNKYNECLCTETEFLQPLNKNTTYFYLENLNLDSKYPYSLTSSESINYFKKKDSSFTKKRAGQKNVDSYERFIKRDLRGEKDIFLYEKQEDQLFFRNKPDNVRWGYFPLSENIKGERSWIVLRSRKIAWKKEF